MNHSTDRFNREVRVYPEGDRCVAENVWYEDGVRCGEAFVAHSREGAVAAADARFDHFCRLYDAGLVGKPNGERSEAVRERQREAAAKGLVLHAEFREEAVK